MKRLLIVLFTSCLSTLLLQAAPTLTLSTSSIDFGEVIIGNATTRTFTVTSSDLKGDVSINSSNGQLSVSPTSIAKNTATSGAQTITLTLTPTGSGSATVTVSSKNATSRTVSVNWTGISSCGPAAVSGGEVTLPGTVNKANKYSASGDMTYYNTDYFDFGPSSAANLGRWAEWKINLTHPGQYLITEDYYCSNGHGWQFQLKDACGNVVATYLTGNLEGNTGTKALGTWNLSSLPAGVYTLRVMNVREWSQPKLRSLTFEYDGEIIPEEPVLPADPSGTSRTYTADNTTIFPNPERGFIDQLERVVSTSNRYCVKGREWYFEESGDRETERLVLVLYYLDNYKNSDLPSEIINAFDEDMQVLRNYGYKCILRYAYTNSDAGDIGYDAPLSRVLGHINQLKAKWAANKDVIYVFQAGFVGAWGEWYYTSNFDNKSSHMTDSRRSLVDALVAALPTDMFIQIRTPQLKTEYIGSTSPISYTEAFTGTPKARLGHHNDAFLYGPENMGTYSDTATQKPYLARETNYVPIGGETNIENEPEISTYATYAKTTGEMSRLHWTYCKGGWPEVTMTTWKGNGTFDELNRKMGYRYQLVNGTYTNSAPQNGTMRVHMTIRNAGYAPLYNERHVYIVLKNGSGTYPLQLSSDPRRWRPNGIETTIGEDLDLTGIPTGTYNLYLYLPDIHSSIASDPRYAIRFANTGVWDGATGYNNLNASITITAAAVEPTLTVTPASVNFGDVMTQMTHNSSINVTGINLSANATVSSNNPVLTVSPSTITPAAAASGQTVTLSLHPTATGSGNAIVTIASTGAESKTVNVSWNGTAVTAVELPGTVNKSNVSDVSGDMTYYNTDYFDFGPTDALNTGRWAKWTIYLSTPAQYSVSEVWETYNSPTWGLLSHSWEFQLMDGETPVGDPYITASTNSPGTVNYAAKWDLSAVPAGVYTLRVKNVYEWAQPKLQSITFSLPASNYTITWDAATNGGTCGTASTDVTAGNAIGTLPVASKGGYTFLGWFTESSGGTQITASTVPTGNVTYYAQFAMPEYVIFDNNNGAGDGNWSTASNWQGGVLPTISQTARIYKPCTVDVTTAVAKEVLIATGTSYTGHLTIAPTAGLRVAQKVRKAVDGNFGSPTTVGAADLTIQASSASQGALVLGTEDGTAQATVQLYSKAYIDTHKHWQYMGVPFSNNPSALSLFSGGYMYRWDEASAAGWNSVSSSTTLNAFAGYSLCQPAAKTYEMTGTLCASSNRNLTVSHTSAGQSGANLFSNSWTAPIEIASFEDGDFSTAAIDKTIYLFNTGSLAEYTAIGGEANTGSSPGQFFAIPIHAAPYAVGLPTVIPPMQGFQVMTTATGGLTLNYARLTAPYDGSHLATEPLKAPKSEETPDVLRLTVYGQSGQSSSDRFYLLKHSACTEEFDNGWDGKKILGSDVVSLYSLSPDGNMAVDSRGEMLGTDIVFCAGTDTHYTIEMYYTGSQTLYLFDRVEGVCVPIISGTNYSFEAASNAAPSIRFRIVANDATGIDQVQNNEEASTKLLRDGHLYIRHVGKLYDARGRKVSE